MRLTAAALTAGVLLVAGCAHDLPAQTPAAAEHTVVVSQSPSRSAVTASSPRLDRSRLDRVLGRYLRQRPGRADVALYDRTEGVRYAYRGREPFLLASVAKVNILLALMLKAQREDRQLSRHERSVASSMIRHSDNQSAHELYTAIGGKDGLTRTLRRLGIDDTWPGSGLYWGATRSTPADQVRVLDLLTGVKGPVSAANRRFALHLMSTVAGDQAWGVSAASDGGKVALKNGWIPARVHGGLWTINSVGRLSVAGHDLLIAVLSERSPSMGSGVNTVEQVARLAVKAITRDERAVLAAGGR